MAHLAIPATSGSHSWRRRTKASTHIKSTAATLGGVLRASVKRWPVEPLLPSNILSSARSIASTCNHQRKASSSSFPIAGLSALMCLATNLAVHTCKVVVGAHQHGSEPENWTQKSSPKLSKCLLPCPLQSPCKLRRLAAAQNSPFQCLRDPARPLVSLGFLGPEGGAASG